MPDVRAPEVCPRCDGCTVEGLVWVGPTAGDWKFINCRDCYCPCGKRADATPGLCKQCEADSFDEQDRIAVRREDR